MNTNGTLRIQDVRAEDEGNYGCTAGNSGGFKRAEFRLLVQGNLLRLISLLSTICISKINLKKSSYSNLLIFENFACVVDAFIFLDIVVTLKRSEFLKDEGDLEFFYDSISTADDRIENNRAQKKQ